MKTIARNKITPLRNLNQPRVGKLTFTELRRPSLGAPGIILRTNDTLLRRYFPGRLVDGETALLGIVLGQYRVLDLEVPSQLAIELN